MKIICWSDFNCPNSYIGFNRIKQAIYELNLDFKWEMKSFEIEPMAGDTPTTSATAKYAIRQGITQKEAESEIYEIEKISAEEGLNINYKDAKITNSRRAHRLIKYAQKNNPDAVEKLIFKIYEANFIHNQIISDEEVLIKIAMKAGLNGDEVIKLLSGDSYDIEVSIDEEDARLYGITAVPFYIIMIKDEQLFIPGAFEKEDFKTAIKDMINGQIKYKSFI